MNSCYFSMNGFDVKMNSEFQQRYENKLNFRVDHLKLQNDTTRFWINQ